MEIVEVLLAPGGGPLLLLGGDTNNYDVILVSTLYCPNYPLVSRRENRRQKLDWTCTVQVKRWCNKCQEKYVLISTLYFVLSIEGLTLAYPSEDNFSSIN